MSNEKENLITKFKKLYAEGNPKDHVTSSVGSVRDWVLTGKVCNAYKNIDKQYTKIHAEVNIYIIDKDCAVVIIIEDTFTFNADALKEKHITFYGDNCSNFNCNAIRPGPSIIESMDFSNLPKLKRIGSYSFYNSKNIGNYNSKTIGNYNIPCPKLKKLTFGSTKIEFRVCCFAYCDKLIEIDFGSGNHEFHAGSFIGCTNLTTLIMPNQTPPLEFSEVFHGCDSVTKVVCEDSDINKLALEFFNQTEISDESPPEPLQPPAPAEIIEEKDSDSDYADDKFVPIDDLFPPGTPINHVPTRAVRERPGTSRERSGTSRTSGGRKPSHSKKTSKKKGSKKGSKKSSQKKSAHSKKTSKKKGSKKGSKKK